MRRIFCDSCGKEIKEAKDRYNVVDIYISDKGKNNDSYPTYTYELCNACYKAMKREIPKLFNWRSRLR